MKNTKRILTLSVLAIITIIAAGATWSVTRMIEIGPTATVTGGFPEIRFIDTDTDDASWEIEAFANPTEGDRLQIGLNGGSSEPFKIFEGANLNSLIIDNNGNIAINELLAQDSNELEVFGNIPSFDEFGAIIRAPRDRLSSLLASCQVRKWPVPHGCRVRSGSCAV